jgi:hypothetical protein
MSSFIVYQKRERAVLKHRIKKGSPPIISVRRVEVQEMTSGENTANNSTFKPNRKIIAAATIAIILILAIALIVAFAWQNHPQPYPTPAVNPIVEGTFTVNAGSYKAFNFTFYPGDTSSWVDGIFTVNGNVEGINVYIMDSGNFINWTNGQTAYRYYETRLAKSGGVGTDIAFSSGTYYLVFDNLFSESSKNVNATIDYLHI